MDSIVILKQEWIKFVVEYVVCDLIEKSIEKDFQSRGLLREIVRG